MSSYTGRPFEDASQRPDDRTRGCGRRHGPPWKPVELLAMILGFIVFWPIGLGVLFWKMWQKKTGYEGDIADFVQDKWQNSQAWSWAACGPARAGFAGGPWQRAGFRMRSTGNRAFDDWRDAELARLEEERQKLVAAEREFAEYIENLRRARDREEFDRFMHDRNNRRPSEGAPGA